MQFTLKPDDNGVIVVLTGVDEADEYALNRASKTGFDPTEEPFSKYYTYDRQIGFHVDKDHFDHAEHKGKRLAYDEYVSAMLDGTFSHSANDATYSLDFIKSRIGEIKEPKDVKSANVALANLNFALYKLAEIIDGAAEQDKDEFHDVIDYALGLYSKAEAILAGSDYNALQDLANQLHKCRTLSGSAQSALLQKYKENF